ncbi:unnamed protein product [Victoria cruziana]
MRIKNRNCMESENSVIQKYQHIIG